MMQYVLQFVNSKKNARHNVCSVYAVERVAVYVAVCTCSICSDVLTCTGQICLHVCLYVCTHACAFVYVCMHERVHVCVHACVFICMCACAHMHFPIWSLTAIV